MQALLGTLSLSSVSVCRMTTLKERLELAMDANSPRTTQAAIAKACGISTAAVAGWFQKENFALQATHCFALSKLMNVDAEWLATGRGTMAGGGVRGLEPRHVALIQAYRRLPQEQRTPIRMLIEALHAALDPKQREWSINMDQHNKRRDGKPAKEKT